MHRANEIHAKLGLDHAIEGDGHDDGQKYLLQDITYLALTPVQQILANIVKI